MNLNDKTLNSIKENADLSPEQWISLGDKWLLEQGVITDVTHNAIVMNIYMNFPKAKYVEYLMDPEEKSIEIHLFFGWWDSLWQRESTLSEDANSLIRQYLQDFKVTVKKKRYGKGEKS